MVISNAPFCQSGYGVQTNLFTRLMQDAGHDVTIFGTFGHRGAVVKSGGIDVLPASLDQYGQDMLPAHIRHYKPDVALLLYDLWVYDDALLPPITAWSPVDSDPIAPMVAAKYKRVKHAWAMSRFAEQQLKQIGVESHYVPHGVDTRVYTPADRAGARKVWDTGEGTFLAVMVAANKGYPSRKSLDRVLKAWGRFVQRHPDAVLYLHTRASNAHDGIDLIQCAQFYGVSDRNLRFPDPYHFERGDYGPERMNALFNAADVLLAPSMGEGFGIPVIEAQSAGCPVIVSDFTAQSELAGPGYKVAIDDDDKVYTYYNTEWALPRPSRIEEALEWAFERKGDERLRANSRAFALEYDAKHVYETCMAPALEASAGENGLEQARRARTKARLSLRYQNGTGPLDSLPQGNGRRLEPVEL